MSEEDIKDIRKLVYVLFGLIIVCITSYYFFPSKTEFLSATYILCVGLVCLACLTVVIRLVEVFRRRKIRTGAYSSSS